MRILVTGSRTWDDIPRIWEALDEYLDQDLTIVHGACPRGADAWTNQWCEDHPDVTEEPHPADWLTHGKAAGFRRNAEMVELGADLCLAFVRDGSPGATHCSDLAEAKGIPTVRVPYEVVEDDENDGA